VPADADWLVVDWKTGQAAPDPVQLMVYRLAWAQRQGVPAGRVAAGFYLVGRDELAIVAEPLDEAALSGIVGALGA
jgi:DNA helicase-2/ATP-dependent DNA helicase PcrA